MGRRFSWHWPSQRDFVSVHFSANVVFRLQLIFFSQTVNIVPVNDTPIKFAVFLWSIAHHHWFFFFIFTAIVLAVGTWTHPDCIPKVWFSTFCLPWVLSPSVTDLNHGQWFLPGNITQFENRLQNSSSVLKCWDVWSSIQSNIPTF